MFVRHERTHGEDRRRARHARQATYKWAATGDINAFFGLMLDNVVNLAVLAGILVAGFGFPATLVYTRMFPGTALGVLFGDVVYTVMAIRLARRTGRDRRHGDAARPRRAVDDRHGAHGARAGVHRRENADVRRTTRRSLAWQVGMATMVLMGVFKLIMSFIGDRVRRAIPEAGLLGSIGGVGIALLGTLQLGEIYGEPIVGMMALGVIIYALVAKIRLPFRAPEVLASVVDRRGALLRARRARLVGASRRRPAANFPVGFPLPSLGFLKGMPIAVRDYLPLALPFAILTVIGGINVTESARIAGDDYNTRDILLDRGDRDADRRRVRRREPDDAVHRASGVQGDGRPRRATRSRRDCSSGSAASSATSRSWPTRCPKPALAPILVFVALDITEQSYLATPRRHAAAVTLAVFPSVAQLVQIFLSQVYNGALMSAAIDPAGTMKATGIMNPDFIGTVGVMVMLAHGFILTAMLWGGAVAFLIDRKIAAAAATLAACAVLSLFGFIHSITPTGGIYLPWTTGSTLPYHWTAAYLGFAVMILLLGRTDGVSFECARAVILMRTWRRRTCF